MRQPRRYDSQTFLLCIDSYDNDIPVGRFSNPCLGESGTFQSMCQLISRIEQCLDISNVPQAFQAVRQFASPVSLHSALPEEVSTQPGTVATFVLQILFRRNASWQGTLTWQEQGQTQSFRSVLELMYLIGNAVEGSRLSESGIYCPAAER